MPGKLFDSASTQLTTYHIQNKKLKRCQVIAKIHISISYIKELWCQIANNYLMMHMSNITLRCKTKGTKIVKLVHMYKIGLSAILLHYIVMWRFPWRVVWSCCYCSEEGTSSIRSASYMPPVALASPGVNSLRVCSKSLPRPFIGCQKEHTRWCNSL